MTVVPAPALGVASLRTMRWAFSLAAAAVIGFLASLIVRRTGSYWAPLDGWGVDAFELMMGALCILRYLEPSWKSSPSAARRFPLVLGVACISWALGDVALTIESLGGATPPVPSVADGFYVCFYPLCFMSFVMVIRRGNTGSLVAPSLDGVIAGLATASISAALLFHAILKATGGGTLAAATNMVYPVGDLLLLALAIGGLAILPKDYRRFLAIASVALATNAVGDTFNLLQPDSRLGYVCDAAAWPIALLLMAIAAWSQPASARIKSTGAARSETERTAGLVIPTIGTLAGISMLCYACLERIDTASVAFATAALFVAGLRMLLAVREAHALNSARFRSMIENAWDLIVITEADFDVSYITPSSERVLGYTPEELAGTALTHVVHPDDVGPLTEQLRHLAGRSGETLTVESRVRHSSGAWRTIAWTATNLLDDPSVLGYVLNGDDVTEARQALEDLAAARDGALMASKAKSEFLSTMSHEIRTPMNGVIGLTELLLATRLEPDQKELATGIKVSADNLLTIINDILDVSKIEAGKIDIEEAPLCVPDVADDVGRVVAAAAHGKGLELLIDVEPSVPRTLLGDVVRIKQVLLNLASNAVKFTLEGEVIIRVTVAHESSERVALRFEVADTGIGIEAGDQQRLFKAFTQADSSTTRRFGGTGLGLTISRQLVDLMGGELGLVSAPGQGSTFWFELSLQRADSALAAADRGDPASLGERRALVVDDNATNRRILHQQLLSWGVETVEAHDAYQALELASAAADTGLHFDLGIIDLNMPGMDGLELARALKADLRTARTILFLLSSSGERLSAAEAHLRGFAGSLTKPVRSSELFDCLIGGLGDAAPLPVEADAADDDEQPGAEKGLILLVEDNEMNQLVGSKVLAKLGYGFHIANHGGEAVAALLERRYDAVLMDCQMPEMDGYRATAEIRRLEGAAHHTPVIAMTAAAMEGDRETCLAAGMDDYITKPVRLEAVREVLERWIVESAPHASAPAGSTTAAEGEAEEPDALDQAQIELLRSLDDGQGDVLGEIIGHYLSQTQQARDELVRVIGARDTGALERAAHTLKGASANVGASAMAAVCAEIEVHGRSAQLDAAAGLVPRFEAERARVRAALSQLVSAG